LAWNDLRKEEREGGGRKRREKNSFK